jgi:hypothetical protein
VHNATLLKREESIRPAQIYPDFLGEKLVREQASFTQTPINPKVLLGAMTLYSSTWKTPKNTSLERKWFSQD